MSLHLGRQLRRLVPVKPCKLPGKEALISFTFDVFPRSAATVGAAILERYDRAGTFYLCGGLAGTAEQDRPYFSTADLPALVAAGHELGSQTYRPVDITTLSAAALADEIARNQRFIASFDADPGASSFSYPFGHCCLPAKRQIAGRFASARGLEPGLNRGWVDLAQLKAVGLFSQQIDFPSILALIEHAASTKAWLIFCCQDVADSPSRYGCTPAMLDAAIAAALRYGIRILPMRHALGAVARGPGLSANFLANGHRPSASIDRPDD